MNEATENTAAHRQGKRAEWIEANPNVKAILITAGGCAIGS
jgi:hypothetical protein